MVAISPHRTLANEDAIDGQGDANREATYSGDEPAAVVGFDDRVQVIRLQRERNDPEPTIGSSSDGMEDGVEETLLAQRRQSRCPPERDVNRKSPDMFGARSVGNRRATARNCWPAGTLASATTGARSWQR